MPTPKRDHTPTTLTETDATMILNGNNNDGESIESTPAAGDDSDGAATAGTPVTPVGVAANTNGSANMTWAQALNDARTLIVQQSTRIKSDTQKLRAQQDQVAQLQVALNETSAEVQRLRAMEPQLAEAQAARDHAEALVGRQRVEIDSLETASRELQRMLGQQASRINQMSSELHRLRSHLPTDEDAAALESMKALLTTARAGARNRQRPALPPEPIAGQVLSGPALARQQRDRMYAEARERELRDLVEHGERQIIIPAEPTPFAQVANRRAA
jgi:hypothetical protein